MSYGRIKSLVGEELKSYFRPEFLNRLDEIIVFRQLTKKEVKQIADIFLRDVFKRAQEKGIKIEVSQRGGRARVGMLARAACLHGCHLHGVRVLSKRCKQLGTDG